MSMYDQKVVGKTKAGKQVAYRVPEGKSLYEIYFVGGGQVPRALQGSWTDSRQIESRVAAYLSQEAPKPITGLQAAKRRPNKLKQKEK